MKYNPEIHDRRSIRLKGYDYSQAGAYFITICTQNRKCMFGEIIAGEMRLNAAGDLAIQCWQDIPDHFAHAELDEWVIMPNHVHGIVSIVDVPPVGAKNFSPLSTTEFFAPAGYVENDRFHRSWFQNRCNQMDAKQHTYS